MQEYAEQRIKVLSSVEERSGPKLFMVLSEKKYMYKPILSLILNRLITCRKEIK